MIKTVMLMTLMTLLLMMLGQFFGGLEGMTFMLLFGVAMNLYYYWNSYLFNLGRYIYDKFCNTLLS